MLTFNALMRLQCWIVGLLSRLWRGSLTLIYDTPGTDQGPVETTADDATPIDEEFLAPTYDEITQAGNKFVESLLESKIEALASRYNGGRSCRVTGQKRGSYNACFFVKFDNNQEWVVRIPIEPAVFSPWETLLSEVATINLVRVKTSIPVAKIHAYGKGEKLTASPTATQMFLILDHIPGTTVAIDKLVRSDQKIRFKFYGQLASYLAELWSLELPAIGSLMPSDDASRPVVGPLVSRCANVVRQHVPSFVSAKAFVEAHLDLISNYLLQPEADWPEDKVRHDMFCISSIKDYFSGVITPEFENEPFVLSHPDLGPRNIIVNDEMDIVGLIDWQFASTVPRPLCTPPSWVSGHSWTQIDRVMQLQFIVGQTLSDGVPPKLSLIWCKPSTMSFHVAHLIRCPADVGQVFARYFSEGKDAKELLEAEAKLFQNPELALEARRLGQRNAKYTEYLKSQGRYTKCKSDHPNQPDEHS
ncbi:hypothetical protein E4U41_005112 [Claviceps citrina]|nr:hypothetical protein E4U41_005112 [Claviceps citrina]